MLFQRKKSVTAKMVGPTLVASFQKANPPLIWKFDLQRNHSFTLALQGEDGDWELGLNSPRGDFYPIVHFYAREDAEEAFEKVQKILMKKRGSLAWRIIRFVFILIFLVLVGIVGWGYYLNQQGITAEDLMRSGGLTQPTVPSAKPQAPMGVPLPADEILKRPD